MAINIRWYQSVIILLAFRSNHSTSKILQVEIGGICMKRKIYAPQVMKYNTTRIENVLQTLKMHTPHAPGGARCPHSLPLLYRRTCPSSRSGPPTSHIRQGGVHHLHRMPRATPLARPRTTPPKRSCKVMPPSAATTCCSDEWGARSMSDASAVDMQ